RSDREFEHCGNVAGCPVQAGQPCRSLVRNEQRGVMDVFTNFTNRLVVSAMGVLTGAHREEGQTFVEYALILAVIAAGAGAALTFLSGQINALYGKIIADVPGV